MLNHNSAQIAQHRHTLNRAKRIVVKAGTHVLTDKNGKPNQSRIRNLIKDIAKLHHTGIEITLITSGAIGIGMQALGMARTATTPLIDLQVAAAIGQSLLMERYRKYFSKAQCIISQVLLAHEDFENERTYQNLHSTLLKLLQRRVIPIINGNDVISVDEIKGISDNDVLSALVTKAINADLLILLTTPNGVYQPQEKHQMIRIPYLNNINDDILKLASGKSSDYATGGMASKLTAAKYASQSGASVVIASGFQKRVLSDITKGEDIGTLIVNENKSIYQNQNEMAQQSN